MNPALDQPEEELNKPSPIWKRALKIFFRLWLALTIMFFISAFVSDYNLITKHWETSWKEYLGIWLFFYNFYLIVFAIFYWLLVFLFWAIQQNRRKR